MRYANKREVGYSSAHLVSERVSALMRGLQLPAEYDDLGFARFQLGLHGGVAGGFVSGRDQESGGRKGSWWGQGRTGRVRGWGAAWADGCPAGEVR